MFGLFPNPEFKLPPLWEYPESIALLILVGVAALGLAWIYANVR